MLRQIFLDTETTGLEVIKGHRITEIGCIEMVNRRLTGKTFHTYLNPERIIDPGAIAISGLTNEFLSDKPKFSEVVDDFLNFIQNSEVIIHNAPFDLSFINGELALLKHPWGSVNAYIQVIDTLQLARKKHPGQKNNLDALCKRYGIDNSHRTYHGALLDAEILSKVYLYMTSGQTTLSLEGEASEEINVQKQVSKQKNIRPPHVVLKVIRANKEEIQKHEALLSEFG